ncbi:MAG: hypothetical protein Q7T73_16625 [Beijerinckiaceae bacterium]|nr:hypothetical protein [Beijerinckiaceae bacterium]
MFRIFFRNESGSTLQVVGTTAGALAVCFMFAAAFLDKATQPGGPQGANMSVRERLAALPRALGGSAPRNQGIDYGATATIPGIRNTVLDPCTGMPK